jgi:serpin B
VPDRIDGLRAVETQFTKGLDRWLAMLSPARVVVGLPLWSTRSSAELRGVLRRLGIHLVLSGPADLPSFTTKPNVRLDRVFHEAAIDVGRRRGPGARDETETGVRDETAQVVRADHPFLYLVRDLLTGIVLVIGRFAGPE